MSTTNKPQFEVLNPEPRKPLDWLLVYSIEHHGGLGESWLKASGLSQAKGQKLLEENPQYQREARQMKSLSRLFTLEMLFALLRERSMEMLAGATKPTELKSLLGILNSLAEIAEKQAARFEKERPELDASGRAADAADPAVPIIKPQPDLSVMQQEQDTSPAPATDAGDDGPGIPELPQIADTAALRSMLPIQRNQLVKEFRRKCRELFEQDRLNRQQRRQLEKTLDKLKGLGW